MLYRGCVWVGVCVCVYVCQEEKEKGLQNGLNFTVIRVKLRTGSLRASVCRS